MAINAKDERIDFRTTEQVKRLIQRAADLSGTTVSSFIVQRSYEAAQQVIAAHESYVLSNSDRDRFLQSLDNPPPPNAALKALFKKD